MKSIRKTIWGVCWRFHDRRKQLVARFGEYLDGLPSETHRRITPGMLVTFTVLALYTLDRTIYDTGGSDGSRMRTGHAGRVEPPIPARANSHLVPYLYGTDGE